MNRLGTGSQNPQTPIYLPLNQMQVNGGPAFRQSRWPFQPGFVPPPGFTMQMGPGMVNGGRMLGRDGGRPLGYTPRGIPPNGLRGGPRYIATDGGSQRGLGSPPTRAGTVLMGDLGQFDMRGPMGMGTSPVRATNIHEGPRFPEGIPNGSRPVRGPKPHQRLRVHPERPHLDQLDEDNKDCSICTGTFGLPDEKELWEPPIKLKCGHIFGAKCFDEWIQDHDTCPMCREHLDIIDDIEGGGNQPPRRPQSESPEDNNMGLPGMMNAFGGRGPGGPFGGGPRGPHQGW